MEFKVFVFGLISFFLLFTLFASAVGLNGSLDAGGFAGESFTWDYSFYVSGVVNASTNDSSHITWTGLNASINYSTAGDRNVRFIFRAVNGTNYTGSGRIRIVAKGVWAEKPRVGWGGWESSDFLSGANDYNAILNSSRALNINTISTYYFSSVADYPSMLSGLSPIKLWPTIYYTDMGQAPYHTDFVSWASYFANLSLTHPNLQAMVIDDYDPSPYDASAHGYALQIMQAKNRVNPNFKILPCLYYDNQLKYFNPGDTYYSLNNPLVSPFTDGVSMFYWGSWTKSEPVVSTFNSYLDQASTFTHVPFYTGFYPISYEPALDERTRFSSAADIQALITAAASKSDGVSVYYVPLWINDIVRFQSSATIFKQVANDDPAFSYRLSLYPQWQETAWGWFQGVTQTSTIPANATTSSISFKIRDTQEVNPNVTGVHFKQLLVNDQIVWEADVASDGSDTTTITKDIASYLAGQQSANITIRLYDKKGTSFNPIDVYVGNITLFINGNAVSNNWAFSSGIDSFMLQRYRTTFNAVSAAMGAIGGASTSTSSSTTTRISTTTTTTTTTSSTTTTSTTTTTSSTSITSTTVSQCLMAGNGPPCSEVALSEVVAAINQWAAGNLNLGQVMDLINSWADPITHLPV